jgi:hypothetical protein
MKYVYKGMALGGSTNHANLLNWHGKLVDKVSSFPPSAPSFARCRTPLDHAHDVTFHGLDMIVWCWYYYACDGGSQGVR